MEPSSKVQFNVYLPPQLVRAVKHASIDDGMSLSSYVQRALEAYLETGAAGRDDEVKEN